ncbi:MAG: hypothetical protein PWP32_1167 [Methanothermobacter sp.]|jgi:hypothetical protein|uniref:Uncharacterized protein n=1 Tax=Methanothermobacter thermautotrophicus TaxID=145262 RepID=A0A7J4MVZ1_METTF|nr:hypothetical protein [Methanothermobacter sp.]MDN5374402.1 hypothetical protein [Methanothermobacter sp.]HIH64817.1 hypothetical protein [Methanothermobacter thermautotrophicus]
MDQLVLINRVAGLVIGLLIIGFCVRILRQIGVRELAVSMLFLHRRTARLICVSIFMASIFTVLVGFTFVTGQEEAVVECFLNLNAFFLLVSVFLLSSVMGGDL